MNKSNKNTTQTTSTSTSTSTANPPTPSAPDLWDRLKDQQVKLAGDAAFVARLRTEGPMTGPDPNPLILEYLRFAYLAWTMPEGATPSVKVDGVWHVHLLFTRSYERFCQETAGRTLHHDPGGGEEDGDRFAIAYRRTLDRYEAEFGPPPVRYWPRPAVPKPEPPPTLPKPPTPTPTKTTRSPTVAWPLLMAAAASSSIYLATTSGMLAILIGLAGSLLFLLAANSEPPAPASRNARPRPRGDGKGTSSGSSCGSDGGVTATTAATSCGDAGTGSCGDGGGSGGGSSCGSSCGGGGCGGG